MLDVNSNFVTDIINFKPNINFLSDIVAFQSAVIAIAIPVSLDIISRISERYNSEVIISQFSKAWQVKFLTPLLLFNISCSVTLKYVISPDSKDILSPISLFIKLTFALFIVTIFILFDFFRILVLYSVDTKFIFKRAYTEIDKNLKILPSWKLSEIEKHQRNLNKSIEALGDILVFQTKNKKENKIVKDGLIKIAEIVNKLLKFQKDDLYFFKKLIFSSQYNDSLESGKLALSHLFAEESFTILTTIINQFQRINETATEVKNIEIINQSIWSISCILVDLTSIEHDKFNNTHLIEQFLKTINNIGFFLLNQQSSLIIYPSYHSSIEWYRFIVFKEDYRERKFNINYLPELSKCLWESIKFIIDNDKFDVFKLLTLDVQQLNQYLIDLNEGIKYIKNLSFNLLSLDTENKDDSIRMLKKRLAELKKTIFLCFSLQKCNLWINNFEEIDREINSHFKNIQKSGVIDKGSDKDKLTHLAKDEFKFNNLKVILFYMAAYCLFKKKFDYIQYLWNYNQPLDADANWIHRDVIPLGTFHIIIFFFNSQMIRGEHYRWDNHHGSSRYLKQYFILLLIRSLYTKKQPEIDQLIQKSKIIFESLNKNCLNDMKFTFLDECINTATEIKNHRILLDSLNFGLIDQVDSVIDCGIIPLLKKIKEQI